MKTNLFDFSNLVIHVHNAHLEKLESEVSLYKKTGNIYGLVHMIKMAVLPIPFCSNDHIADLISIENFQQNFIEIHAVIIHKIMHKLSNNLPNEVCLVFDGCTGEYTFYWFDYSIRG